MESVYDLTDSLYRQGWEHAESVDDYFYGDFPVLEMKHQVYAMTAMRRYVAKSLSTCETGTQTGEVCPSSWVWLRMRDACDCKTVSASTHVQVRPVVWLHA